MLAEPQSASQVPGPPVNVYRPGLSGLGLSCWQIDDCRLHDTCDAPNRLLMIEIALKRAVSAEEKCGPNVRWEALARSATHYNQSGSMLLGSARQEELKRATRHIAKADQANS
jgi:DNA-binding transcriptional regulator YdaS (Cro superfamily)